MCENLFDGVSQPVKICAYCGEKFEGTGEYCSEECDVNDYDDYWDDDD